MNPCNGMISPPAPKTPGNHGRYRHIHLGAYVLAHHVSYPIRLMRIAHSHNVLDSSRHTSAQYGLCRHVTSPAPTPFNTGHSAPAMSRSGAEPFGTNY